MAADEGLRREAEAWADKAHPHTISCENATLICVGPGQGYCSCGAEHVQRLYLEAYFAGALAERPRAEQRGEQRGRVAGLEWALMACQPPADLNMLRQMLSEELDRLRSGA